MLFQFSKLQIHAASFHLAKYIRNDAQRSQRGKKKHGNIQVCHIVLFPRAKTKENKNLLVNYITFDSQKKTLFKASEYSVLM